MSKLRRFGTGRSLAAQPKTIMRFGDDVDVTRVRTTTVAVMPMREAMALGSDPDGTPVIIIVTPTEEIPTYRVTHVVRKEHPHLSG